MESKTTIFEKILKQRTLGYVTILLLILSLFVVSSYAWFSISATPRVSDMAVFINAPTGMRISEEYDAPEERWVLNIDLSERFSDRSILKPISYSYVDDCFKVVKYLEDGRTQNQWKTLIDSENANKEDDNNYYLYTTFYAKTDTDCAVYLADAVTVDENRSLAGTYVIGRPIWNQEKLKHDDGGQGSQYATRVGFRVTNIDPHTGKDLDKGQFYIYEPNSDIHLNGTEGYVATSSIDGIDNLVEEERLFIQTSSNFTEANPAQQNVTVKTVGTFTNEPYLFNINTSGMAKVDMYIWIEGNDLDCYGLPNNTSLIVNIQFDVDYKQHSGLQVIGE